VDRRYNQRISAELPLRVSLLDSGATGGDEIAGQLYDLSESGMSALLPTPADPGALVRIEILGIVFYGQVAYCNPVDLNPGSGEFRIGIFVEPALLDSSNLVDLVDSFLIDHVG
jgi:hypothetical protein